MAGTCVLISVSLLNLLQLSRPSGLTLDLSAAGLAVALVLGVVALMWLRIVVEDPDKGDA